MDAEYPGLLDASSLLEVSWDLEVDPFTPKSHQNYRIRGNVLEGRDYMLVSHKVWRYLKGIYGGMEVKRMIITHLQSTNTYVDVPTDVYLI